MGEGDSNFARNQRMTAAEMMARKTRLCREIWQRQVHSQPSLMVCCHALLLCFAVMLCCCAWPSCFAVALCSPHAWLSLTFNRCAHFCPFSFACLALALVSGRPSWVSRKCHSCGWSPFLSFVVFFAFLRRLPEPTCVVLYASKSR